MSNDDKCAQKMKALLSLADHSIIQIDDRKAVKRINSEWELRIDVSFPPKLWEAVGKGKAYDWKRGIGVPPEIIEVCNILEERYLEACDSLVFETAESVEDKTLQYPEGNDEVSPERLSELQKDLENELKKPVVPDPLEDDDEAKKQAEIEEKNRLVREENERKLEMMERGAQAEARAKEQKKNSPEPPKRESGIPNPKAPGAKSKDGAEIGNVSMASWEEQQQAKIIARGRERRRKQAEEEAKQATEEDELNNELVKGQAENNDTKENDEHMSDNRVLNNSSTDLPRMVFKKVTQSDAGRVEVYLSVRGPDLGECKKHLEEFIKAVA